MPDSSEVSPVPPIPDSPSRRGGLSKAALIVGIIAVVCAVIPGVSFVAFIPALIAVVLGIGTLVRKAPTRGRGIAGILLGVVSFVVAIVVSIALIAAGVGAATATTKHPSKVVHSAAADPSSIPSQEPTGQPSEPAVPVEPVVPADTVYSGSGDSVLPVVLPDGDGAAAATITANGARNFVVWSLDANMAQQDLLVNTIGAYQGTVGVDLTSGASTKALQIKASGAWSVTIHSLAAVREFTGNATSGTGDDVVVYRGKAGAAALTNAGDRNFVVWSYSNRSDLAVNTIGAYSGTVIWQAGPTLVVVKSNGAWTITVN